MNTIRFPRRTVVPLVAAGALFVVPAAAQAAAVEPAFLSGNPSCLELGYPHEIKFDPPNAGQQSGDGVTIDMTLGADALGTLVDWSASAPIDAVLVKGGDNANAYVYPGESTGDSGLHTPLNGPDKYFGLSHVSFCWDDETPPPPGDDTPPPPPQPPAAQPPVTPPTSEPPIRGGVLGGQARPGSSRLSGPSGCAGRTVKATVRGARIAKVVFYLDGRKVKTVKGAGAYSVRSATLAAGVHRIKAKVVYKAAAATRPRTHVLTFQRCVARRIAPRFAG